MAPQLSNTVAQPARRHDSSPAPGMTRAPARATSLTCGAVSARPVAEGHDAPRRRSFWTDRTGRSGDRLDTLWAAEKATGNPADYATDHRRIIRHLVRLEATGRLDGVRLAADAGEWMHGVRAEPIGRSDFQAKVEAIALAMASVAHQQAVTVRRRHALLAEAATVHAGRTITSRDVGKVIKRLGEYGLVVVLVAGRAPRDDEAHGTVPMYALTIPETLDLSCLTGFPVAVAAASSNAVRSARTPCAAPSDYPLAKVGTCRDLRKRAPTAKTRGPASGRSPTRRTRRKPSGRRPPRHGCGQKCEPKPWFL